MSDLYDVVVIGSGPAGYPAAIRAGQHKLKVACVDEWINTDGSFAFGGTCLNAGCIPSKALLESSELYQRAKEEFSAHGIKIGDLKLDLATMQKRRASVDMRRTMRASRDRWELRALACAALNTCSLATNVWRRCVK